MQRAINGFLPDGTLINNVANFYRSTKPLTRIDGSALVVGDVWYNPSTGVQGSWNGTYWLGNSIRNFQHRFMGSVGGFSTDLNLTASTTAGSPGRLFFAIPCKLNELIWLDKLSFSTDNVSGNWTVGIASIASSPVVGAFIGSTITPTATSVNYEGIISTAITKSNSIYILQLRADLSGSGALRLTDFGIYYNVIL